MRYLRYILLFILICSAVFTNVSSVSAGGSCADASGEVVDISLPTSFLSQDVMAKVYLPPCYHSSNLNYPVLYLLHGRNNTAAQWLRIGVSESAQRLMGNSMAPFIIVMPDDLMEKNFDQALVYEVVPFIDANFRTIDDREHRALGGLSHGGGWALHIGLEHDELFSRVGGHSPDLFVGDAVNLLEWGKHLKYPVSISIDIGSDDSMITCCAIAIDGLLARAHVPHTYDVHLGGHTEEYWASHLDEYLRFYSQGW